MKAIQTAMKLEQVRLTMMRLMGDRYEQNVKPWKEILSQLAAAWECGPLEAIVRISEDMDRKGRDIGESPLLFAAAAELCGEERRNGTAGVE